MNTARDVRDVAKDNSDHLSRIRAEEIRDVPEVVRGTIIISKLKENVGRLSLKLLANI